MKIFKIIKIDGNQYTFINKNKKTFTWLFEFFDLPRAVAVNDYILLPEYLLHKSYDEYDNFYRFGNLESQYGRDIKASGAVIVEIRQDEIVTKLKRIYG